MNRELILNLGKLMVAVAWVDGILAPQEIDTLRELIAKIPGITAQEKAQIEIFMDHHVSDVERESLVRLVADLIKTPAEKELVVSCLRGVVASDGEVTEEEEAALEAMELALSRADIGVLQSLSRALWRSVGKQQQSGALAREEGLDDFMRNRVFYYLMLDPLGEGLVAEMGEDKARLISLVTGLMLRVLCAGWSEEKLSQQSEAPSEMLAPRLVDLYQISSSQAGIFVDIAWLGYTRGLDGFLLGCALQTRGSQDDLLDCYAALLALAYVDPKSKPNPAVQEELLDIAHALQFDQTTLALAHQLYLQPAATS